MNADLDLPIAFLYQPGVWPPLCYDGEFRLKWDEIREDYPFSEYKFRDLVGRRCLWVNVHTKKTDWTCGEIVFRSDRAEDLYFEDKRSPIGPFMHYSDRYICEDWVFIPDPEPFLIERERQRITELQQRFQQGDDQVLKQGAMF